MKSGMLIFSENWMVTFCSFFEKKVDVTVIGVTLESVMHVCVASSNIDPLRHVQAESISM